MTISQNVLKLLKNLKKTMNIYQIDLYTLYHIFFSF